MIKIIDLFAGPGGLGEGFASFVAEDGVSPFSIVASVEKETSAHNTLQLRAFYRQFPRRLVPEEYYQYVRGEGITKAQLYEKFPKQSQAAIEETLGGPRTLGVDNHLIDKSIVAALKGNVEPVIVIGGPPCQAYSLVGRARNLGNSEYVAENDPRHFLYKEYLRILNLVKPEIFVMENVKGILSSKLNNELIFPKIIKDLQKPGVALNTDNIYEYKIYSLVVPPSDPLHPNYDDSRDFIIHSEKYGVAQARHRVILLGVRADLEGIPGILQPMDQVNIEEVIGNLPILRSGLSKAVDNFENWQTSLDESQDKLSKICRELQMMDLLAMIESSRRNANEYIGRGGQYITTDYDLGELLPPHLSRWLIDKRIKGVLNHQTRGHIQSDLERYLFCACFAEVNIERFNPTPKSKEFPDSLAPNHKNWKSGKFADRFRVQVRGKFATTITSHISKDGHYFIHYDPKQCRSLTVREAARIQSFPDNYFFEGNRTQQYTQVGNAVPPYLASQVANIVFSLIN